MFIAIYSIPTFTFKSNISCKLQHFVLKYLMKNTTIVLVLLRKIIFSVVLYAKIPIESVCQSSFSELPHE